MIPAVDKKFEEFDVENFNKSRIDFETETDHTIYTSANSGYSIVCFYKSNNFSYIKNYFPSRNIQNKGIRFNNGSQIGIWYHYDESGKLIKEEDTDIGYDFGPMEVLRYCKKNGISLPKGYQEYGFHTRVLKLEREGKKVWKIFYPIKSDLMKEIVLDGKTGKELEIKFKPIKNS
ncbi:hypothetical protein [Bergeyella zoohelcum]|uniref:MORN repeat variant n=1 Tax=Bergeyella zoohelcum TaxID=1015 RepID=A0A380ZUQ1_9FLAO|nr:hypothetical protein [Bergeyella zoohelcum]SUV52724.1 Uncharacterised protein [Bergeyella zoohelcum]